ncbi:MAG: hypothetical protein IKG87_00355 [Clostridia bacterium]|nr:hypothetical protein [Clostridia bacterium]
MMKRRITAVLLALAMCPILALAEQERYTIGEIRDQAERLLETYGSVGTVEVETTKGRFNVTIDIPEVDRVPVLKVTHPSSEIAFSAPEGDVTLTYEQSNDSYLRGWGIIVNGHGIIGDYIKNTHRVASYDMDARADGSPMTLEESIAFAEQILSYYQEQYGWEFAPYVFRAYSRRYKATDKGQGFVPDLSQPVDDTGYYILKFNQAFYGIPYYDYVHFINLSKNNRQTPVTVGGSYFIVFSSDRYNYDIYPSIETAVLAEDVPLCALETVIESLKESGRIYPNLPTSLRFVYMSLNDPDDRNGDLVLFPAWILESDSGPELGKYCVAVVHAQTGKWINPEQKDTDGGRRSDAVWFGWEDIYEE